MLSKVRTPPLLGGEGGELDTVGGDDARPLAERELRELGRDGRPLAYDAKTATTPMKRAPASAAKAPRISAGSGATLVPLPDLVERAVGGLPE